MSIESESEFFNAFKIGGIYRRNYLNYSISDAEIQTEGLEYSDWNGCDYEDLFDDSPYSDSEMAESLKDVDFKDIDFEDDFEKSPFEINAFDSENESLIPYEFEMDTIDVFNPDAQIKSYAADFWELVSITGDKILFKRPKYING
jgi:hypothetical protein